MSIALAYRQYTLAPGEAFAVPTVPGAMLRVVQGLVWATTSNRPADTWLRKGEEHEVETAGLTVIEASLPSVVELLPPIRGRRHGAAMRTVLAGLAWLLDHASGMNVKIHQHLLTGRTP